MQTRIVTKDKETGKEIIFYSVDGILYEVNRNRGPEWDAYDKLDWREGLEFIGFELLEVEGEFEECPFCHGLDAELQRNQDGYAYVKCPGCGATGGHFHKDYGENESALDAINHWNDRKTRRGG